MQYMELWLDRCVEFSHQLTIDLDGLADPTFKEIKIYYLDSMVHPPDFKIGELSWNKETPPLCTCTYINDMCMRTQQNPGKTYFGDVKATSGKVLYILVLCANRCILYVLFNRTHKGLILWKQ